MHALKRARPSRILSVAALLLAAACTRAPPADRNTLAGSTDDLAIASDLAYAKGSRHGLDVYALRTAAPPRPVLIYLYGGGWSEGSKAKYKWLGAALARKGYVAVVPDYRIYPEGVWPKFIEDNAAAVRWVKDNIGRFGGDPSKIVLVGHSAGAFNGFTLCVDHRWLNAVGLDPARDIKAFIGLSGPYLMWPPSGPRETAIFGNRGYTEPAYYVDGKSPPMLLLVGAHDRIAGPELSPKMAELVQRRGGSAKAILYLGVRHGDTENALGGIPGRGSRAIQRDIGNFLAAQGIRPAP